MSVRAGSVRQLVSHVWDMREADPRLLRLPIADTGRLLAAAVSQDLGRSEDFDPEDDPGVLWLRAILLRLRRGERPRADDYEGAVEVVLGKMKLFEPCGKDRAAGE